MEKGDERTFHRMQNYLMADQEFVSQGDLVPGACGAALPVPLESAVSDSRISFARNRREECKALWPCSKDVAFFLGQWSSRSSRLANESAYTLDQNITNTINVSPSTLD